MSIRFELCSVVYVDDDLNDHFLLHRAVKKTEAAIDIHPFVSARPAFDYIKKQPPTFLLCDYDLGPTKGSDLVSSIRAIAACSSLPIIMLSGADDPNAIADSYDAGADHFLRKPADPARMVVIVRTLYACATVLPAHFRTIVDLPEYEPRPLSNRSSSVSRQFTTA